MKWNEINEGEIWNNSTNFTEFIIESTHTFTQACTHKHKFANVHTPTQSQTHSDAQTDLQANTHDWNKRCKGAVPRGIRWLDQMRMANWLLRETGRSLARADRSAETHTGAWRRASPWKSKTWGRNEIYRIFRKKGILSFPDKLKIVVAKKRERLKTTRTHREKKTRILSISL